MATIARGRSISVGATPAGAVTTIDAAIEQIGVGRFQWRLLLVNGLTWAADAMEVLLVGFIIPSLRDNWKITATQASYVSIATFAGMFLGAWLWGMLSDRIGRRRIFLWTVVQTAIFGTLAAFSPNLISLLVLRFLTGTAMGGTLPVDYAIMAEYLPTKARGRFLIYLESFWALGTVAVALLAWLFIPGDKVNGWRYVVGFGAVLGLLGFWIRRSVPESPRFLLINGRADEAKAALERVAAINGRAINIGTLRMEGRSGKSSFGQLWQGVLARKTLLLSVMWFTLALGYYGILTWLPTLLRGQKMLTVPIYEYSLLLAIAQIPGYALAGWMVEKWGRKQALATSLFASAVFSYLFTLATTNSTVLAFGMLLSFSLLGAYGAIYVITPELFPTEVRATGMGWTSAMSRVAGMTGPFIGAYLIDHKYPLTFSLTIYAALFVVGGIATLLLGRDTKGVQLADLATQAA